VSGDVDLSVLAAESAGLTGGDLVNVVIRAATMTVNRHGAQRIVTLEDLRTEVRTARQAKSEVGKAPGGARLVSVRQVPAAELATDEFALSGRNQHKNAPSPRAPYQPKLTDITLSSWT
jgi:AAA+ lid domain